MASVPWTKEELDQSVRAYLWMLRCIQEGFSLNKKRVRSALLKGPLNTRTNGSIEYRFQNISAVLDSAGGKWIDGYKPAKHVGASTFNEISRLVTRYREPQNKHFRRLNWLINALPETYAITAAKELSEGASFDFPESTDFDVLVGPELLPPKKVIAYAALKYYNAPLFPDTFSGGEGTACFNKIRAAGLQIVAKDLDCSFTDPEHPDFRGKVVAKKHSYTASTTPNGNPKPKKTAQITSTYVRDPAVVAFIEQRAKGDCELCKTKAPFHRSSGEPFLEVHHIVPLSENGPDTVENAVALCPNCHRECHHGERAEELRKLLKLRIDS